MEKALKSSKISSELTIARDGNEALDILREQSESSKRARPDIILLDLNMPTMSGHEVLVEIKSDDDLKSIPVIIMTSSESKDDINLCYKNHANCYIRKPLDLNKFDNFIAQITDFWFATVEMPSNS